MSCCSSPRASSEADSSSCEEIVLRDGQHAASASVGSDPGPPELAASSRSSSPYGGAAQQAPCSQPCSEGGGRGDEGSGLRASPYLIHAVTGARIQPPVLATPQAQGGGPTVPLPPQLMQPTVQRLSQAEKLMREDRERGYEGWLCDACSFYNQGRFGNKLCYSCGAGKGSLPPPCSQDDGPERQASSQLRARPSSQPPVRPRATTWHAPHPPQQQEVSQQMYGTAVQPQPLPAQQVLGSQMGAPTYMPGCTDVQMLRQMYSSPPACAVPAPGLRVDPADSAAYPFGGVPVHRGGQRRGEEPYHRFFVCVDFEATTDVCSDGWPHEIIEIGAVVVDRAGVADAAAPRLSPAFRTVVRPALRPLLTRFCREFTGLTQADVDAAPPLPAAIQFFHTWLNTLHLFHRFSATGDATDDRLFGPDGQPRFVLVTDGPADVRDFMWGHEVQAHRKFHPAELGCYWRQWLDVRALFETVVGERPSRGDAGTVLAAMRLRAGLPAAGGRAHSAAGDARSVAGLLHALLVGRYALDDSVVLERLIARVPELGPELPRVDPGPPLGLRVDPADGVAYSFDSFVEEYGYPRAMQLWSGLPAVHPQTQPPLPPPQLQQPLSQQQPSVPQQPVTMAAPLRRPPLLLPMQMVMGSRPIHPVVASAPQRPMQPVGQQPMQPTQEAAAPPAADDASSSVSQISSVGHATSSVGGGAAERRRDVLDGELRTYDGFVRTYGTLAGDTQWQAAGHGGGGEAEGDDSTGSSSCSSGDDHGAGAGSDGGEPRRRQGAEEVAAFLTKHLLGRFLLDPRIERYEDMASLRRATDEDLQSLGMKAGHIKRFRRAIADLS